MPPRFRIQSLLGKGRSGGVYRAYDHELGELVAVRRFFTSESENPFAGHEDFYHDLAGRLQQVGSGRCVAIHDAGFDEDGAFLVMPLLEGESLRDFCAPEPWSEWQLCRLGKSLIEGLACLHLADLIHGSIDPGSVHLTDPDEPGGSALWVDGGLSRVLGHYVSHGISPVKIWQPAFTAPEVFETGKVSARSDLFGVGQLLFHVAAGHHPLLLASPGSVVGHHRERSYPTLKELRPDLSDGLIAWIDALIEPDEDKRPPYPGEALVTLHEILCQAEQARARKVTAPNPVLTRTNRVNTTKITMPPPPSKAAHQPTADGRTPANPAKKRSTLARLLFG